MDAKLLCPHTCFTLLIKCIAAAVHIFFLCIVFVFLSVSFFTYSDAYLLPHDSIDDFIECLMAKFKHLYKAEVDEVIGNQLCTLIYVDLSVVFHSSLHQQVGSFKCGAY